MEVNVKITVGWRTLEVSIPVDSDEGAVEMAAKHLLLNHCGWKEVLVDDGYEEEQVALMKGRE